MKEWNTPSVEELNVAETANGFFNTEFEAFLVANDSKKPTTPEDKPVDKPVDTENQLS